MTTLDAARPMRVVLDSCRARLEPAMRAAVETLPPAMREIIGYHLGHRPQLPGEGRRPGGKAIRPALTLLSAAAVGGSPEAAVPAAVAVELVHNFSLLHDDVMDRDRTRRHRPTAWVVYGIGPAILAGDAALTLAMDVLAASRHPESGRAVRLLSGAVQELVDGQSADLAFERRADVGLRECVGMAENKTGALLGCACALGALLGGGTPRQVRALDRFGRELGLVFQLVDDMLGIWGDPAATGKPVRSDLRCRKKSLPVVAALTSGTPAGRALGVLYHRAEKLSDGELARAAELIELAGGRAWCRQRADELLGAAERRLGTADLVAGAAAELRMLARVITRRDR